VYRNRGRALRSRIVLDQAAGTSQTKVETYTPLDSSQKAHRAGFAAFDTLFLRLGVLRNLDPFSEKMTGDFSEFPKKTRKIAIPLKSSVPVEQAPRIWEAEIGGSRTRTVS
jgi:hypothetical protein